jgi:hypothetical protein
MNCHHCNVEEGIMVACDNCLRPVCVDCLAMLGDPQQVLCADCICPGGVIGRPPGVHFWSTSGRECLWCHARREPDLVNGLPTPSPSE